MEAIQLYTNQFNKYFCSRKSDSTICIDWYSTSCFYKPKYFIEFSPGYSNFPGGILPAVNWCVFDNFDLCLFAVFEHSMPKQKIKMKQIDKAAVFSITLFNSIFSDFLISKIQSYVFFCWVLLQLNAKKARSRIREWLCQQFTIRTSRCFKKNLK